jgi:ABC-type transporter Mla subunit MlaD
MRFSARPFEKMVGVAIVAALLILVAAVVFTSHGKQILQKSKTVKFYLDNGNGLEVGSKVLLNGLPAGSVEALDPVIYEKSFDKDERTFRKKIDGVLVTMRVFSPYSEKIRKGSKAYVQLPFIMGSTVIDITPGPIGSPEAPDDYVLEMKITKGIGGQVEDILGDLQIIARDFKDIEVELKKTMENVEGITNRINAGNNSIGELLNDDKRMYKELLQFASDADLAAQGLNDIVGELKASAEKLPAIMEDLGKMAENLEPASANFEKASTDFEPLVKDARSTLTSLEKTARKLESFSEQIPGIGKGLGEFVGADLPVLVTEAKKLIGELNGVSSDLRQTTEELPALVDLLHTTADDADDVIRSLKGTWPIRGNLPERRVVPKVIRINGRIHRLGE